MKALLAVSLLNSVPLEKERVTSPQHNGVFSGGSKWETVVNAISFGKAGCSSCLSCLFSQGNTVLSIAVVPKNQIIWILDTSAQNWRHSAKSMAYLEKNIVQHHSFIRLSVWCDKFTRWGGLGCCTFCFSVPESPSFDIPTPYKLTFHLSPLAFKPLPGYTDTVYGANWNGNSALRLWVDCFQRSSQVSLCSKSNISNL